MFYSGIDQHKHNCMITTYDANGQRVKQQRVLNSRAQLRRYFAAFSGPHQAVVESTGFWYWLADLLEDLGVDLTLAHATRLKAIAAAKVKTDRLDSDLLAQPLRADLIPAAHRIDREARGPRRPRRPLAPPLPDRAPQPGGGCVAARRPERLASARADLVGAGGGGKTLRGGVPASRSSVVALAWTHARAPPPPPRPRQGPSGCPS